ncbi:MAG: S9 family peptidase, partial [Patescibacteria group bacterium]|nr:S9 family peptidase [Patescibacteria group bacterium]
MKTKLLLIAIIFLSIFGCEKSQNYEAPKTKIQTVTDTIFGHVISDDYRWLEDDNSEMVKSWTKKQNRFTREML